jgi:hypothetical protein
MSPRWRESPKDHPKPAAAPIDLVLVDWLLTGRPRPDDRDPLRHSDVYDHWLEFDPTPPPLRELWNQHRSYLQAEHGRRGGTGKCWAERTFDDGEPNTAMGDPPRRSDEPLGPAPLGMPQPEHIRRALAQWDAAMGEAGKSR